LATGEDSIRKLIVSLDQKKETALHTTFKMVARHFAEVFKTIVPGGEGKIIMKTSTKRGAAQVPPFVYCWSFSTPAFRSHVIVTACKLSYHEIC